MCVCDSGSGSESERECVCVCVCVCVLQFLFNTSAVGEGDLSRIDTMSGHIAAMCSTSCLEKSLPPCVCAYI